LGAAEAFRYPSYRGTEEVVYLSLGEQVHFPPEEGRHEPGYWALFFFDPDGIRIEVAYWNHEQPG
jgi:catechol 2,3-dioxygenase-like lactoylglutathione lyase family enzyme